jgi:hypothetical protein
MVYMVKICIKTKFVVIQTKEKQPQPCQPEPTKLHPEQQPQQQVQSLATKNLSSGERMVGVEREDTGGFRGHGGYGGGERGGDRGKGGFRGDPTVDVSTDICESAKRNDEKTGEEGKKEKARLNNKVFNEKKSPSGLSKPLAKFSFVASNNIPLRFSRL